MATSTVPWPRISSPYRGVTPSRTPSETRTISARGGSLLISHSTLSADAGGRGGSDAGGAGTATPVGGGAGGVAPDGDVDEPPWARPKTSATTVVAAAAPITTTRPVWLRAGTGGSSLEITVGAIDAGVGVAGTTS